MSTVTVVGAAGHVGLPFSLVCADAGHKVYGLDVNNELILDLNHGIVPYVEHGAEELLKKNLSSGNIEFTDNRVCIRNSDVVAIMLGTPVDEENNPRLDDLINFVDSTLTAFIRPGTLVLLRSTVAPGTTEIIKSRIEQTLNWKEGKDFYLVFCPERVLQTKGIEETKNLPTVVGAFCNESYFKAKEFLETFNRQFISHLTPEEAEVAKLMTNMWRRLNGAFANELYMIGDRYKININRVIDAANHGYNRMNVMTPGFMAGPCLYKDGLFLTDSIPYNEMIKNSFEINEGFVGYVFNKSVDMIPNAKTFGILGTGFKADCDDERYSLSFKMKKMALRKGLQVKMHDPYHEYETLQNVLSCDIVVMMVPHKEYLTLQKDDIVETRLFVDIWKKTDFGKKSIDGFYRYKE